MAAIDFDLRRTDQRTNVRVNPFWVTSSEFTYEQTAKASVLFAFPEVGGAYFVHDMVVDVIIAFDDTPTIDIGYCTLDDPSVDLTYSNLDADQYMVNSELDATAIARYPGGAATEAAAGTDWALGRLGIAAKLPDLIITGADTVMPAIIVTLGAAAASTVGKGRLHIMVSKLP